LVPGYYLGIPRPKIAPVFSAAWGLATIVIIYFLGRELFGPTAGLLAAAMYGGSGFAALYTRIAAAESFGFFCLALAVWQYARLYNSTDEKRPILSPAIVGVWWALAILANYRLLLTAAIVLTVCESIALFRRGLRSIRRPVIIASSLFGTLILTEVAFRVAVAAWRRLGGEFRAPTYWEQLRYFLFEKRPVGNRFNIDWMDNLYHFGHYWWKAEGPALSLLAAIGVGYVLSRRTRFVKADGPLALASLLVGLAWTYQHFVVPRVIALLCVLLSPFAGYALYLAARRLRLERSWLGLALFVVGYVVLLGTMVYRVGPIWFDRPGAYRELADAVKQAGNQPLYAFWRQKPGTALYVIDRPIRQVNEHKGVGVYNPDNMPADGLLVAESDYIARTYPDAEILGHWPTRSGSNELIQADDWWSWDRSVARKNENIELLLVKLRGPPDPAATTETWSPPPTPQADDLVEPKTPAVD
jgi:hypothetical protein